jgi:hypothetical protein
MSNIRTARSALITRIVDGDGRASQAERRAAFAGEGLAEPLSTLVHQIVQNAHGITDDDIARACTSGLTEDQLFEIAVCAAVGQATRQHDAALAALDSACQKE